MPAEAMQSPPEDKPKATDLDPRPDLAEDHRQWVAVLSMAWHRDRDLWGLLHGLRCGGARLEVREGSRGSYYRIDYMPLLSWWDEGELRRRWLEPYKEAIKQVLQRALETKRAVEAELAAGGGTWNRPNCGRPRVDKHPTQTKLRWEWTAEEAQTG